MDETKATVLVVDDDGEMTSIIKKILTREGYEVYTAENGGEALELMRRYPMRVVIADWKMPVLDGMKLIDIVQSDFPESKIIMITAFGEMDQYLEAMNRGAFEFLAKPLNINELKSLVARAAFGEES